MGSTGETVTPQQREAARARYHAAQARMAAYGSPPVPAAATSRSAASRLAGLFRKVIGYRGTFGVLSGDTAVGHRRLSVDPAGIHPPSPAERSA